MSAPTFWTGTKTPKSTGNAFDLALAKPSGFATTQEALKAKKHALATCDSFTPLTGLSQKARKALQVPAKRVSISIAKPSKKRMSKKASI
jgi:hypothetical protein